MDQNGSYLFMNQEKPSPFQSTLYPAEGKWNANIPDCRSYQNMPYLFQPRISDN